MGGLLAARLQLAGHEVQLVARGTHGALIAKHGLELRGGFGNATVPLTVVEQLDSVDLALLCVKLQDSASALATHAGGIGPAPTVLVQNGIDGFRIARAFLATDQLFGAISLIAANYTADGLITVTNPSDILLGRGTGPADAESQRIASVLNDAVPTSAINEFEGAMWTKLVFNMVNAIPAITGMSVQEVGNNPWLVRLPAAAMREAAAIGRSAGIAFGRIHSIDAELIEAIATQSLRDTAAFVRTSAGDMGEVPNLASMLQSVRRGKPTEVDFLNGAVVRVAESIGQTAPINHALTSLVHRVERRRRHLGPWRLRATLAARGIWL